MDEVEVDYQSGEKGEISVIYEENESNEDIDDDELRAKLQREIKGSPFCKQIQQIKDLRDLYKRANSRLTLAKCGEDYRLKKAENKIVSFLEEDDVEEMKELKVFEKMEKFTGRPSFGSRASLVEQFMKDKVCLDSTQSEIADDVLSVSTTTTEESESEEVKVNIEEDDDTDSGSEDGGIIIGNNSVKPLTKDVKRELESMQQLREKLETTEVNLAEARKEFEKYKHEELSSLEIHKKQLAKESEKLNIQFEKLQKANSENEANIHQLREQIRNTNSEWTRKLSRWNVTRKNMQEKIDELEKRCSILQDKNQKMSYPPGKARLVSLPFKPKPPQRVQFQDEKNKDVLSSTGSNANSKAVKSAAGSTKENIEPKVAGYFGGSLSKAKEPVVEAQINSSDSVKTPFSDTGNSESSLTKEKVDPQSQSGLKETPDLANLTGDVETIFPNGTRKYVSQARNFTRTMYKNGDIKEKRSDGSMHYFFAEFGLRHYIYPNGLEMISYSNGQIQRKNPDGTSEILFPNGCVKFTRSDGKEEFIFPDNTVYETDQHGNTTLSLPSGQKEVHNELWKKRIFPDGTTKTIYSDGTSETQYPNGRVRIKNAAGKLISDTQQ